MTVLAMKKTSLFAAMATAAVLAAVSCSDKAEMSPVLSSNPRIHMEFNADAPSTRTAMIPGDGTVGSENQVVWSAGDAISLFDGTYNNAFIALNPSGNSSETTFSGEALPGVEPYYALYPYSAEASFTGSSISSVLPAEQHYVSGTFDTMLNPAVAKASGNELSFQNVASILRLDYEPAAGTLVREVQVRADRSMSGEYTVSLSGTDFYAEPVTGDAARGVRLVAENGGHLGDGPYYLTVLPGTYSDMQITVIFTDDSYIMLHSKSGMEFVAGEISVVDLDRLDRQPVGADGLYGLFMAGADIYIAGKAYNREDYAENDIVLKTNYGDVYKGNSDGKIIFVDIPEQVAPLKLGHMGNAVIVGNDLRKKARFVKSGLYLNAEGGRLVLANLDLDFTAEGGASVDWPFVPNCAYGELTLDNCDIDLSDKTDFLRITNASNSVSEFKIMNSRIRISPLEHNYLFLAGSSTAPVGRISFVNNIVYSPGITSDFRISTGSAASVDLLEIRQNTFVNINTSSSFLVYVPGVSSSDISGNLVWTQSLPVDWGFIRISGDSGQYPEAGVIAGNFAYSATPTSMSWKIFHDESKLFPGASPMADPGEDPFSGGTFDIVSGTFIPGAEYAGYGAQRSIDALSGSTTEDFGPLTDVTDSFSPAFFR